MSGTKKMRLLTLHAVTLVLLGWVSYGSHEVLLWIGMPWWPAWIYPAVVDLALLYVTPFAVDAGMPDDSRWPIRSEAKRIRQLVLPMVAAFNVLHMVLFVQERPPHFTDPSVTVAACVIAYLMAVTAGFTPVWIYARVVGLEVMYTSWGADRRREAKLAEEREAARQGQEEREHRMELERIAAQSAAKARIRAIEQPAEEEDTVSDVAANSVLAQVPGNTKGQKIEAHIRRQWELGVEKTAADFERDLYPDTKDTSYGRKAMASLRAKGVLPPSERGVESRPRLALAQS